MAKHVQAEGRVCMMVLLRNFTKLSLTVDDKYMFIVSYYKFHSQKLQF